MKILYVLVLLPMLIFMNTGCIKENMDDCDNVTIHFQYFADGTEDVLPKYIDKVDLYVFDENEILLGHETYSKSELENSSAVHSFRLEPGKPYKVVALGNAYEHTTVANLSAAGFDHIYVQHVNWGSSSPVTTHDHNYMGSKNLVIPDQDGVIHSDTVILKSSHINVDIRISGFNVSEAESGDNNHYALSIEDSNPQITFRNLIRTEEKGTCYPELVYDAENQCYRTHELALFRLDNQGEMTAATCAHTLVLTNAMTNEELIRQPIYQFLNEHAEVLSEVMKQEANLAIELVVNNTDVEIKVPDWDIEETTPEWGD